MFVAAVRCSWIGAIAPYAIQLSGKLKTEAAKTRYDDNSTVPGLTSDGARTLRPRLRR